MYLKLPLLSSFLDKKDFEYVYQPSATISLMNIIKGLNVKSIAVPGFLCEEILLIFYNLDIQINFYKLDADFSPILKKKHVESECLFICDYFGKPIKNSNNLEFYINKTCKPIIIDRCHSLLAGSEINTKNNLVYRNNIYLFYSLRKFLPIINGCLLISKKKDIVILHKNKFFISKKKKFTTYIKNFIKVNFNNNKIGRSLLGIKRLFLINKNSLNQINGFNITTPNLNKKKIELGYYFKDLDIRYKNYIYPKVLNKLMKKRDYEIKNIKKDIEYFINKKNFEIKESNINYGSEYGVVIKFKPNTSKFEIENNLIKPLLKINRKVEIFLWPFNINQSYEIDNLVFSPIILVIPKF